MRFRNYNDSWCRYNLSDVTSITMGQSPSSSDYTDDSSYPVLVQGNADLKNGYVYPRIYTKKASKWSSCNDVIFTVRAPVGYVALNQFDRVAVGRGVASISGNTFFYYLLRGLNDNHYWDRLSSGSVFSSISSKDLKDLHVYVPNEFEQNRISSLFDSLDKLISLEERKLESLKKIRKAYLRNMFYSD